MKRDAVAGSAAGFLSVAVTYPLDLLKVRYQCGRFEYVSYSDAITRIFRTRGLRAFWDGVSVNLFGSTIAWGLYFALFERFKLFTTEHISFAPNSSAAWASGFCVLSCTQPIWNLKANVQVQDHEARQSILEQFRSIYTKRGLKGFYRGFIPNQFGNIQASIQMTIYKNCQEALKKKQNKEELSDLDTLSLSISARMVSQPICYPYQVIKTHMQDVRHPNFNLRECVRSIYDTHGFRGFYRGLVSGVLKVLPAQSIVFVTYERIRINFKKNDAAVK